MNFEEDVSVFEKALAHLPTIWDGRKCILELKEADYNWKQMEWMGFYFEFKARQLLKGLCDIPGDEFGSVTFDLKLSMNWDLKANARQAGSTVILNDKSAMNLSIQKAGGHGEIIARCDVDYNDDTKSFKQWHSELKGRRSNYEIARIQRNSNPRRRKTHARLKELIFLLIQEHDTSNLNTMRQGRNSGGSPRRPKYSIDLNHLDQFTFKKLTFNAG